MKAKKNLAMGNMQLPTMKISGTISRARAARMIVASGITSSCCTNTVQALIDDGRIVAYQLRAGGHWHVVYESVVNYIDRVRRGEHSASSSE